MLMPPSVRVFLAAEPVDLRGSFYRLASHVRGGLSEDPQSGHFYVFIGRRRNLVKILFWDRSGYCLFSKKLEGGRFALPEIAAGTSALEVDFAMLTLLLEGINLRGAASPSVVHSARFGLMPLSSLP